MDASAIHDNWNTVCNRVKAYEGIDASQVNAFFSRLEPQAMSEGFLMLTADNDFIKSWIERHYLERIKQALAELFGMPFTVILEVDPAQGAASATPVASAPVSAASSPAAATPAPAAAPEPAPAFVAQPAPEPVAAQPAAQLQPVATAALASEPATSEPSAVAAPARAEQPPLADAEAVIPAKPNDAPQDNAPTSTYTFENYVIGDSNRMAYSMAVAVAEDPGSTPLNPLFIYGKSGLGKTHLMRAIQNYIRETQPHLKTIYVDSGDLLSDYMEAGAAHSREKSGYKNFKAYYEGADVLLIDDVQRLQGKKQTLDIVFQMFNKLTDQGKQIVLSADRAPKNIDIDERYHSRFNQGGTIDIQPPDMETKLGIVKSYINEYSNSGEFGYFTVPEEVQEYIAENSSSNIRELKGAVTMVIYQISMSNQPHPLTISDARRILENHFSGSGARNLTVEDIQKEVEGFFKVKHADLVGKGRSRNIVYPRQIAIYLCRQLLDVSYKGIGEKFNRDHATVLHSVKTVEDLVRDNHDAKEEIETIRQIILDL